MTALAISPDLGTELHQASPDDWAYIDALRKREGSALGFVPRERYQSILERRPSHGRYRYEYEQLLVTRDNGDLTGFIYASFGGSIGTANIYQVVVQEDARRWHRAALMVGYVRTEAERRHLRSIHCRVAVDLEAHHFWQAMGYQVVRETSSTFLARTPSKSGRVLTEYELPLAPRLALL